MDTAQFNALIARAKKKDGDAICILSKYCVNAIKLHLSVKFYKRCEIEDWARDVFAYKILSNLPDKYVSYPIAWLNKISDNYVFTLIKNEIVPVEFKDNISNNKDFNDKVNEMMAKDVMGVFSEIDCRILLLRYYYGYKSYEVADMLNLSADTVRQRASRAIAYFKKFVTKFE